ncbi:MAG: YitT family protein, partial [Clostridia bacterium]|nr:YitT family protein [Clostridia bacterium]
MKSLKKMLCGIKPLSCIIIALSGVFLAFGLYNVHSLSGVTEGGILGLNLLLEYWFNISPAVTNFVFSAICYFIGWRTLGRKFIIYSAVAAASLSASYAVLERFPQLWPQLYEMPLVAAILGAVFVGVGTGVAVRCGGAPCGDDA